MRRTKFAAALMIVTAGSALMASSATAEEVKAHGHMPPPPREWREPREPGGPGGNMPPHNWDRGPRPGRNMPPNDWRRPGGPGEPGGPRGSMPPHDDWRGPGRPGGPGGHMPPSPRW